MAAAQSGNTKVARMLLAKGAKLDAVITGAGKMNGMTAEMMARVKGHDEFVELLKQHASGTVGEK